MWMIIEWWLSNHISHRWMGKRKKERTSIMHFDSVHSKNAPRWFNDNFHFFHNTCVCTRSNSILKFGLDPENINIKSGVKPHDDGHWTWVKAHKNSATNRMKEKNCNDRLNICIGWGHPYKITIKAHQIQINSENIWSYKCAIEYMGWGFSRLKMRLKHENSKSKNRFSWTNTVLFDDI